VVYGEVPSAQFDMSADRWWRDRTHVHGVVDVVVEDELRVPR
jgi:hypothetical protein